MVSDVTVADVRVALGDVDTAEIPDAVIDAAIVYAETFTITTVADVAALDPAVVDAVVTAKAAHRAFTSSPVEKQRAALDLSTTWDTDTYVATLEARVTEALALAGIAPSPGGFSAIASPYSNQRSPEGAE